MTNTYHKEEKKSSDPLDPQTVFTATHAEISRTAVTQCKNHKWQKLNDNEIYCPVCESGAIVNPEVLETYLK